jgi:hypothetical protein
MIDPFETFYLSLIDCSLHAENKRDQFRDDWKSLVNFIQSIGAHPVDVPGRDLVPSLGGCGAYWEANPRILAEFRRVKFQMTSLVTNLCPMIDAGGTRRVLLVCDLDSTLIETETVDEISRLAGPETHRRVEELTRESMAGNIDFCGALHRRCQLLAGLDVKVSFQVF